MLRDIVSIKVDARKNIYGVEHLYMAHTPETVSHQAGAFQCVLRPLIDMCRPLGAEEQGLPGT